MAESVVSSSDDEDFRWFPEPKKKPKISNTVSVSDLSFAVRGSMQAVQFRRPGPSLPWERGYAGRILNQRTSQSAWRFNFCAPAIPIIDAKVHTDKPAPYVFPAQTNMTARARIKTCKHFDSDDVLKSRALMKWRMILESDLEASEVGFQMLMLAESMSDADKIIALLNDVLALKATATLTKRVNAILGYVCWGRENSIFRPLLFEEPTVYSFLNYCRIVGCAPTKPKAFLQAVAFFGHAFGSGGARAIGDSSRIRGLADGEYLKKLPLKQARPLTVLEVRSLEHMVMDAEDVMDQVAAGQFVFNVLSCSRFSDPQWSESMAVEVDESFHGYIDMGTRKHKTATSVQKKTQFLPLVAPTFGLRKGSWAKSWLAARKATGLEVGSGPMLPAPSLKAMQWLSRPLTSAEGAQWLREILVLGGTPREAVSSVTTHSLKVTVLSWAAKFGTEISIRRQLGHHADPQLRSTLTYSRDAMSGPMLELEKILDAIRKGTFRPDMPRHQRFLTEESSRPVVITCPGQNSDGHDVPFDEVGPDFWEEVGQVEIEAEAPSREELVEFECDVEDKVDKEASIVGDTDSESDSDSSDSLSESCMPNPSSDEEAVCSMPDLAPIPHSNFDCIKFHVFQHRHSGILHVRGDEPHKFACKRLLNSFYHRIKSPLKFSWPNCLQCQSKISSTALQSEDLAAVANSEELPQQGTACR